MDVSNIKDITNDLIDFTTDTILIDNTTDDSSDKRVKANNNHSDLSSKEYLKNVILLYSLSFMEASKWIFL